ncbi:MAG: hypothetical protein JNK74_08900 [Candidatus Hydrogenedentes bacterium]|nr:hypothetical protein [Candidatus Hydrogenedentota bacterium]
MKDRFSTIAVFAIALLAAAAGASEAIEWPRLGRPAVTAPKGLLEVGAREEGALSLEREGRLIPLNANWFKAPGAIHRGRAAIPEAIAPGRYGLQLVSPGGTSIRKGAVHILADTPEEYDIAVVRGALPAEGAAGESPLPGDLPARLAEAQVAAALIIGPLTPRGAGEDYQALEALLAGIEAPVYLCPHQSDLRGGAFRAQFGSPIYGAPFGRDGFLFLGAGLPAEDPRAAEFLGEAHLLRRALRAARWSIGVAAEFGLGWDLHAQMALFVDDPLNALIAGSVAPGLGATVPWGGTAFVLPAEGPREAITVVSVTPTGIRLRKEAATEQTPPAPQDEAPVE